MYVLQCTYLCITMYNVVEHYDIYTGLQHVMGNIGIPNAVNNLFQRPFSPYLAVMRSLCTANLSPYIKDINGNRTR